MRRSGGPTSSETDRVREIFEDEAEGYDRKMGFFERLLFAGDREWVCSQAEGNALEIGIGTGRNLPFYPDGIRLTAVELSPAMLDIARQRARDLGMGVDLRVGDAQQLELADNSFDTVVITFCLCTIPDDAAAVAEARRVLRPGGRLVLAEHVRSPIATVRAVQRLIDPLMVRFQGDHMMREPLEHLQREDFVVDRVERRKWGIVERATARAPVDGAATDDMSGGDESGTAGLRGRGTAGRTAGPPARGPVAPPGSPVRRWHFPRSAQGRGWSAIVSCSWRPSMSWVRRGSTRPTS